MMDVLTSSETPVNLFPNGGWDVHHHIFERMDFEHDNHLSPEG